jgi:hypothetical protein
MVFAAAFAGDVCTIVESLLDQTRRLTTLVVCIFVVMVLEIVCIAPVVQLYVAGT